MRRCDVSPCRPPRPGRILAAVSGLSARRRRLVAAVVLPVGVVVTPPGTAPRIRRARTGNPTPSLGIQWYQVTFDAEYITPFEAGAGTLRLFYQTHADPREGAPPPRIITRGRAPEERAPEISGSGGSISNAGRRSGDSSGRLRSEWLVALNGCQKRFSRRQGFVSCVAVCIAARCYRQRGR